MTQPIDIAYVDVVANTKPLVREIKNLKKPVNELEKIFDDALNDIDKNLLETADSVEKSFDGMADSAKDASVKISKSMSGVAKTIDRDFNETRKKTRKQFLDIGDSAKLVGDGLRDNFVKPTQKAFGGVTELLIGLGSSLAGLVASSFSPTGLIAIAVTLVAIVAVAGPLLAVVAALADLIGLIGLLPGVLTIAAAAIAPLVIAFNGFGEAISAVISKDPKKIAEALKELAPAARSVVLEFQKLLPAFDKLGDRVQQAFFKPLKGALTEFGKTILPSLSTGLTTVATALGKMVRGVIGILTLPEQVTFLNNLFKTTADIINKLSPGLNSLLIGFLETANASLPTFSKLAGVIGNALKTFGDFLTESARNGDLQKFLDDALTTLGDLVELGKALGGLFGTIFGAGADDGRTFLETITDLVKRMDEFFKSAEGQDALNDLFETVKFVGSVLGGLTNAFIEIVRIMGTFDDGIRKGASAVGEFITKVVEFVKSLPDRIGKVLSLIPEMVGNFFKKAFDAALFSVGVGIGLIIFAVTQLPGQIAGFISRIPGQIGDALSRIPGIISGIFSNAKQLAIDGILGIVNFIKSVPDKIIKLKQIFINAGKNLITSFMNGFRSVGSFIGDVAGDIVRSIKGFLNRAIDKINDGISAVDAFLPGDLPRIPRLARGGLVKATPGGILANIGEGGEDEVVAPLSEAKDMFGGPSITFGPGSINVVFEGGAPSAQEAFNVGQSVGRGIISTVAKRNVRMQVRTV